MSDAMVRETITHWETFLPVKTAYLMKNGGIENLRAAAYRQVEIALKEMDRLMDEGMTMAEADFLVRVKYLNLQPEESTLNQEL